MISDSDLNKLISEINKKKKDIQKLGDSSYSLNIKKGANTLVFIREKRKFTVEFKGQEIINGKKAREIFELIDKTYNKKIVASVKKKREKAIQALIDILNAGGKKDK